MSIHELFTNLCKLLENLWKFFAKYHSYILMCIKTVKYYLYCYTINYMYVLCNVCKKLTEIFTWFQTAYKQIQLSNAAVCTVNISRLSLQNYKTHIHTYIYTHIYIHTHTHKNAHTNKHTQTNTHIYTHKQTHTHKHTHIHTQTNTHTQTHKHTHIYTHTQTYTHTNTHRSNR